jgi:hypothetical protein
MNIILDFVSASTSSDQNGAKLGAPIELPASRAEGNRDGPPSILRNRNRDIVERVGRLRKGKQQNVREMSNLSELNLCNNRNPPNHGAESLCKKTIRQTAPFDAVPGRRLLSFKAPWKEKEIPRTIAPDAEPNSSSSNESRRKPGPINSSGGSKQASAYPPVPLPGLDAMSDSQVLLLTESNTKKNAHRNLKARFARIWQSLESLAIESTIGALPLIRPGDMIEAVCASDHDHESFQRSDNDVCYKNGNGNFAISDDDSQLHEGDELEMAIEPASIGIMWDEQTNGSDSTARDSTPFSFSLVSGRRSVRISTSITIVTTIDNLRNGRSDTAASQHEIEDHPNRCSARAMARNKKAPDIALMHSRGVVAARLQNLLPPSIVAARELQQ